MRHIVKRYFYNYFLRDFNAGTIYSIFGVIFLSFGIIFGGIHWISSLLDNLPASSGTVMLAALPVIIGIQFLIAFLHHDISNTPQEPLSGLLNEACTLKDSSKDKSSS